ncbi:MULTISPECIES: glycosyltransferase family 87 protein [unclassified Kaistella]|uniref:glycosyltransferase family 87 protein n=1 Tax=unclassified Kaistella TaxID=2762626 RepID=UPI0027370D8A|nr:MULTISPECIES: glycosyltransferase family 87 protein [unclassified Kaistella]MDP2454782.1 glycosyltransferase family 87 protein [Kaistella sp. SH11-4b]MDP2457519.1 glycosyltransferase family 87 protein [Kaistella sp. SH40-3]MDP2460279.1 glycosyltransferase family 87 protein [Kaistella sp. SH19-2b]
MNLKDKFLKFISNLKYIFGIYLLVTILSAITKYRGGPEKYNNYMIFKNVFTNTLAEKNIYLLYPDVHFDSNHYGVFFSVLIAPFAIMPDWLGMVLWNVANTLVFLFAIHKLPFSNAKKAFFAWLCLQEFITAAVSLQFNIALTGLLMLSAVYIYERKETQSAISILIGFFVKLYGIAGLSAFFFIKNKWRFILSLAGFGILFLILPMVLSSAHFGIQSYADWFQSLSEKNASNQVLGNRQDYSLMGIVRRVSGNADISNLTFLLPGMALFGLPYLRVKQYKNLPFQLMILASTLLFIVLFSSGSESPTFIIAVAGVMIWFLMQKEKSPLIIGMLIFVIILTCFSFSDLFPKFIKDNYIMKYSLKALPCCIVWFRVIYELLTKDFAKDYQLD